MTRERKEYLRLYRLRNKEKIKQWHHNNYLKNKKKISLYVRRWYVKNRKRISIASHEDYLKNKDKILTCTKKWQKEHRDQFYEYQRQWREKRRLKNLAKRPKRRYLASDENLEYENRFGGFREKVIQRDGEKCRDCGLNRKEHKKLYGVDITVHHLNHKGRNSDNPQHIEEELLTLCLRCHGKRDALERKE